MDDPFVRTLAVTDNIPWIRKVPDVGGTFKENSGCVVMIEDQRLTAGDKVGIWHPCGLPRYQGLERCAIHRGANIAMPLNEFERLFGNQQVEDSDVKTRKLNLSSAREKLGTLHDRSRLVKSLKKRLEVAQTTIAILSKNQGQEEKKLLSRIAELESALQQENQALQNANQRVTDLEAEVKRLQNSERDLSREANRLQEEKTRLSKELRKANTSLATCNFDKKTLQDELNQETKKLIALRARNANLQKLTTDLEQDLVKANNALTSATSSMSISNVDQNIADAIILASRYDQAARVGARQVILDNLASLAAGQITTDVAARAAVERLNEYKNAYEEKREDLANEAALAILRPLMAERAAQAVQDVMDVKLSALEVENLVDNDFWARFGLGNIEDLVRARKAAEEIEQKLGPFAQNFQSEEQIFQALGNVGQIEKAAAQAILERYNANPGLTEAIIARDYWKSVQQGIVQPVEPTILPDTRLVLFEAPMDQRQDFS